MSKKDINDLTREVLNTQTTTPFSLLPTYSNYFLYIEDKDNNDIAMDFKYQLYTLFDSGINNLSEDDWNIIISERINSQTEIQCDNNYNKIIQKFGNVDNVIEYEHIHELASSINENENFSSITSQIYEWLNRYVDFSINRNPENADDTNLILTKEIFGDIQRITETILNKVFRNLIQLIRVRHDYRLYAPGATIFGGKATEFSTDEYIAKWSALPQSCWQQYSGQYLVGKSAYNESIKNISDTIKNSKYHIGSYTSYAIAPHTHQIDIELNLPTTASASHSIIASASSTETNAAMIDGDNDGLQYAWKQKVGSVLRGNPKGFANIASEQAAVEAVSNWSYSWNSDSNCKLRSSNTAVNDIFNKSNVILPTYASYVWKWVSNDESTNITSPRQFIHIGNS